MAETVREMICISCPMGCHLEVRYPDSIDAGAGLEEKRIVVSGNRCPRGEVYGREELLRPRRVVTATMSTNSELFPRIPVKSAEPVPRGRIPHLLDALYRAEVSLPARRGQVLASFEGIDFLATRSIGED
jgi:CxxC motif-containing protein